MSVNQLNLSNGWLSVHVVAHLAVVTTVRPKRALMHRSPPPLLRTGDLLQVSTTPTTLQWRVLSSAPTVQVLARPDVYSGRVRPTFTFAADWGDVSPDGAENNVTFVVSLLADSDPTMSATHVPRVCHESIAGTVGAGSDERDCLLSNCSSTACTYVLYLLAPGTYTLQVHTLLFSSQGVDTALQWTYRACAVDEFGVVSGNDTVTCQPCPQGGSCAQSPLPSTDAFAGLVTQADILAQPGFWASPTSDGLTFYR